MIKEFAIKYLIELKKAIDGILLDKFEEITNIILDAYNTERSIFIMGNGGSGTTASHFACDINKGCCSDLEKRFKVICLNDNIPIMLAYANDKSYDDIFVEQLKNFLEPGDVVIGISGSGNSKNILKAIEYANKKGAITIGLTGYDGGRLADISKVALITNINDMQKVEDTHLIITHILMQFLSNELRRICKQEKTF